MYHTLDMSRILTEGLNHYTVVYGLNCGRLKDSVVGHQSTQWKIMEDCFRDICNIGAGCERAKGYCRAKFNTPEASMITKVKIMKEPGSCYNCTNHKSNNNNKFQKQDNHTTNYKRNNFTQSFHDNRNKSIMFPTGVLSLQVSQQIRSDDDMSVSINRIKHFLRKIGEN